MTIVVGNNTMHNVDTATYIELRKTNTVDIVSISIEELDLLEQLGVELPSQAV